MECFLAIIYVAFKRTIINFKFVLNKLKQNQILIWFDFICSVVFQINHKIAKPLTFNNVTTINIISKFLAQDNDFPAFWLVP